MLKKKTPDSFAGDFFSLLILMDFVNKSTHSREQKGSENDMIVSGRGSGS